jgi:hypothetical protein
MKKITTLFFVLISVFSKSQTPSAEEQRQLKYWYYRHHLTRDFSIGMGANPGQSLIFDKRRNNDGKVWYGDVTINSAYYIAMLAIEIRQLSLTGYDCTALTEELYYAIEAINRLDLDAETYYNKTPSLDGFFIRDDMGKGLYDNGSYLPSWIPVRDNLNTNPQLLPISEIESDWLSHKKNPTTNFDFEMSIDQFIHLLYCFSLVKECLSSSVSSPSPLVFSDGKTNFHDEIKAISERIMNQIHNPNSSLAHNKWQVKTPNGDRVNRGFDAYFYAYGFSRAYKKLTGNNNPKVITQATPAWQTLKSTFGLLYKYYIGAYGSNQAFRMEGNKVLSLVTSSNCCGANSVNLYLRAHAFDGPTLGYNSNYQFTPAY